MAGEAYDRRSSTGYTGGVPRGDLDNHVKPYIGKKLLLKLTADDLQELYRDKQKWNHMSLKNISNAGIFSADRSIMDYARDIWGATPVK